MRILVVGSGGREHALVWKLAQEAEVFCSPGNAGIAQECECFDVETTDLEGLVKLVDRLRADLVVIGPEDPLISGLADRLIESQLGVPVLGPFADGARHEGSKAWSKKMMSDALVPTASGQAFHDHSEAVAFAESRFDSGFQVVVKASGAALGKGVVVCDTLDQAQDALAGMMLEARFGEAGRTVVVEDRLSGREFSLLTLVSGPYSWTLPVAQDYKRALDGDNGPNTGGMGSCSPVDWVDDNMLAQAEEAIVRPMVRHMAKKGMDYRGVLFSGVMLHDGKPYCLEYNVRFGDPETQSVLRKVGPGFANSLLQVAEGQQVPSLGILPDAAVTVVVASGGYPEAYEKGKKVTIGPLQDGVKVFHAATKILNGDLVTNGGRVLGVSAVAGSVCEARRLAYEGVRQIHFEGMHFRTDIAGQIP